MKELLLSAVCTILLSGCTDAGVVLSPPPGPAAVRVDVLAAGPYHTCGIDGGKLVCWGANKEGELGVGDLLPHTTPVTVAGLDWREIVAGESHSCARRTGGSLWCWGANNVGQLGLGNMTDSSSPAFVSTMAPATQLGATYSHTCAVDETHALYCWGANEEGQIGQDDPFPGKGVDRPSPTRVGSDNDWILADGGQGHTCGIRSPGALWCWGRNSEGELGLGPGVPGQLRVPQHTGTAIDWIDIRLGQASSCGLRAPGTLWCWGGNIAGETGQGDLMVREAPTQVGAFQDWTVITLDTFHACGVRTDGSLYCWGRNDEGQLGLGDNMARLTPTRVGTDSDWVSVAAGRFHTCALKRDRSVLCTGRNDEGELGTGDQKQRDVLTLIQVP